MTKRARKRKGKFFILIVILAFLAAFDVISDRLNSGTVSITVPKGISSRQIAEILKDNNVIKSKTVFLARLYFSPYRGKLKYGNFKFDKNTNSDEVIKILATKGAKKNTVTVTIPEGYSVEKIKDRFLELGLCTDTEFEQALKANYDYDFLKSIPSTPELNYRLQGFLFPSTYEFYSDASAEDIINKMLSEFGKQTKALNISNNDLFTAVTKASLIEREAKIDRERSTIAGVLENRLKANMRLQIDATVVYVASFGKYDLDRVTGKHLKVNSKYNTYKYAGLPPGPICCPSLKSIKAALNPEMHNYLYYHTDTAKNDGSHIFTKTLNEHNNTK